MVDISDRADRVRHRKARTRAALVEAAQSFLAQGRTAVPVLEITQVADVGMGSFYNHFESKEHLFRTAVDEALEAHGEMLDDLTTSSEDPAEVFTRSFRITGRLHRIHPEHSRVILSEGASLISSEFGLAPRARRDLAAAAAAGRFTFYDLDLALALVAGAALGLAQLLHDQPDRDDSDATDRITEDLLRTFGLAPAEARRLAGLPLPDIDGVPLTQAGPD